MEHNGKLLPVVIIYLQGYCSSFVDTINKVLRRLSRYVATVKEKNSVLQNLDDTLTMIMYRKTLTGAMFKV